MFLVDNDNIFEILLDREYRRVHPIIPRYDRINCDKLIHFLKTRYSPTFTYDKDGEKISYIRICFDQFNFSSDQIDALVSACELQYTEYTEVFWLKKKLPLDDVISKIEVEDKPEKNTKHNRKLSIKKNAESL